MDIQSPRGFSRLQSLTLYSLVLSSTPSCRARTMVISCTSPTLWGQFSTLLDLCLSSLSPPTVKSSQRPTSMQTYLPSHLVTQLSHLLQSARLMARMPKPSWRIGPSMALFRTVMLCITTYSTSLQQYLSVLLDPVLVPSLVADVEDRSTLVQRLSLSSRTAPA